MSEGHAAEERSDEPAGTTAVAAAEMEAATAPSAGAVTTCQFPCDPPCVNPLPAPDGPGRPSVYCGQLVDGVRHDRPAAYRARQKQKATTAATTGAASGQQPDDLGRPVEMARTRAAELLEQAQQVGTEFLGRLERVVTELQVVADPDAAAAQIEAERAEAERQIAEAASHAARVDTARRDASARADRADQDRADADAAAQAALAENERLVAELADLRAALTTTENDRDAAQQLAADRQSTIDEQNAAAEQAAREHDDALAAAAREYDALVQARDVAVQRASEAEQARRTAEHDAEAARTAAREDVEYERARTAGAEERAAAALAELAAARAQRDDAREETRAVRAAEREAADQRVADAWVAADRRLQERLDAQHSDHTRELRALGVSPTRTDAGREAEAPGHPPA